MNDYTFLNTRSGSSKAYFPTVYAKKRVHDLTSAHFGAVHSPRHTQQISGTTSKLSGPNRVGTKRREGGFFYQRNTRGQMDHIPE